MLPRLAELETDLLDRRARAEAEGWAGEIEGIDLTLSFLHASATKRNAETSGRPSTSASQNLAGGGRIRETPSPVASKQYAS